MVDRELRRVSDRFDQFKAGFERWKESVAFHSLFYQRQVKVRAKRQGLFINLRTATNENLPPAPLLVL